MSKKRKKTSVIADRRQTLANQEITRSGVGFLGSAIANVFSQSPFGREIMMKQNILRAEQRPCIQVVKC